MPEETQLSARQLLRFSQTNHPHKSHILDEDIRFARLLAPEPIAQDLIPYPLDWLESLRSFQAFLRRWRLKYAVSRVQSSELSPSLQLPRNPSLTRRHLDESRRRAQRITEVTAVGNTGSSTAFPSQQSLDALPTQSAGLPSESLDSLVTLPSQPRDFLPTPFRRPRIGPLHFPRRNSDPETPSISRLFLSRGHSSDQLLSSTDEDYNVNQDTPLDSSNNQSSDSLLSLNLNFSQTLTFRPDNRTDSPHTPHPPGYFPHLSNQLPPEDEDEDDVQAEQVDETSAPTMAMTPEQIADIVSRSVAATMEAFRNPQREGTPGSSNDNSKSLKPDDVGYFNPNTKDPEGHGIVASGRVTIYTNVHAFTNRLDHLATTRGEQAVKDVWGLCLQGTALHWHTIELSDLERTALSQGDVALIRKTLEDRFKKTKSDALKSLSKHVFTLYDLFAGKSMRAFVQQVLADAKACDLPMEAQLLWAFESFDSEIQGQLIKPDSKTTLSAFLDKMDEQESVLINRANERFRSQQNLPQAAPVAAFYVLRQQHMAWEVSPRSFSPGKSSRPSKRTTPSTSTSQSRNIFPRPSHGISSESAGRISKSHTARRKTAIPAISKQTPSAPKPSNADVLSSAGPPTRSLEGQLQPQPSPATRILR
ncbi:hypothetical protein F4860DRAFT_480350 [Xylaria cubensis]|nr:hypothetical protein F4860DRAFT_480350 [Xylaria cubensis]